MQERTADDSHVCFYDTAHHRNYAIPKSCYLRSVKTLDEVGKTDGGDSRGPSTSYELRLPDLRRTFWEQNQVLLTIYLSKTARVEQVHGSGGVPFFAAHAP